MNPWKVERKRQAGGARNSAAVSVGAGSFGHVATGVLACLLLVPCLGGQDTSASQAPQTLAVINGQAITEDLLPASDQAQLQRMMTQVYAVQLRALHAVVDRKLLDAEAKRRGVSVEELLRTEVDAKVPDPSDAQVSAYYQASRAAMNQPLDQIKEQIRAGMKGVEIQKARTIYIGTLWQQAVNDGQLAVLMTPPKLDLPVDPARVRGESQAPVTIVEFSDFSCPYCRQAEPTIAAILEKYPGKVKLAYRDFPLSQLHPHAEMAAEAARCAGEQGKFWEYHDLLFVNYQKQSPSDLMDDARTLKLDEKQFETCVSSGRYKPQIERDVQIGSRGGVVATPAFFIDGTMVSGAQPAAAFEKIIDEELASSGKAALPGRNPE